MSNIKDDDQNDQLKGITGYDWLVCVKPLKKQLLVTCRAYYQPHQNLAIDERIMTKRS